MKTFKELVTEIKEALKRTVVYRAGKKKVIKKSTKAGYKNVGGKRAKMAKKRLKTMRKRGDR